jgi:hypothetical protein
MGKQVEDGVEVPRYALDLIGDLDYIPEGISVLCAGTGAGAGGGEASEVASSKNRYFKAGLPNPRSLIRKSSPTTPTTSPKKQRPRPQSHPHPHNSPLISNLFSVSESSQTTTARIPLSIPIASHDSTMSLPTPFIGDGGEGRASNGHAAGGGTTGILRTSTSTTSSSFEIVHSIPHVPHAQNNSPTKPVRQRFSFLGRK